MTPGSEGGGAVVVTGGASGIGQAIVLRLLRQGKTVTAVDRDHDALSVLEAICIGQGYRPTVVTCNVCDENGMHRLFQEVAGRSGLSGLVACAGISRSAAAATMEGGNWQEVLDINLTGSFLTCQSAFPHLAENGGSIVLVGSTASLGGFAARANYSAAKTGLVGLARTLAIEWGQHRVRVNVIAPGSIATERAMNAIPDNYLRDVIIDRTPLARHGSPDEVAAAVCFLLSSEASFITGATLPVDGGLSAGYLTHRSGTDNGGIDMKNHM